MFRKVRRSDFGANYGTWVKLRGGGSADDDMMITKLRWRQDDDHMMIMAGCFGKSKQAETCSDPKPLNPSKNSKPSKGPRYTKTVGIRQMHLTCLQIVLRTRTRQHLEFWNGFVVLIKPRFGTSARVLLSHKFRIM